MHATDFKLHAASEDDHGSFTQGKIFIFNKTIQKHLNNLHEKVGDAGMGSGLFHKGCNKNNDNNDVDDIECSESKSYPASSSKSSCSSFHSSSDLALSYVTTEKKFIQRTVKTCLVMMKN